MKKTMSFILMGVMVLALVGMVSATSEVANEKTIIAGKIYNSDFSQTVANASVTVTCEDAISHAIVTDNVNSLSDGAYSVVFYGDDCVFGDTLTVSASHPDYGYNSLTGVIHEDALFGNWDLAIVNVPLVPEFGLIAGMVTILGAVGLFFFVRKK